jgi:fatty-acyl-CoA synthase
MVCQGATITYGELHVRVKVMASWLVKHGIGKGDRVTCLALNSKAYTEFFLALAWIGAVAVPLNMRLHPKELRFIVEDSGAIAMFSCGALVELAESAIEGLTGISLKVLGDGTRQDWTSYETLIQDDSQQIDADDSVSGDTLFMLLYTSGTTGQPKGCMIPQRSWTGYAVNMATCFQMGEQDVYLAFLPYFHVAGFGTAFSQLVLGGTIVTAPIAERFGLAKEVDKPYVDAALRNRRKLLIW